MSFLIIAASSPHAWAADSGGQVEIDLVARDSEGHFIRDLTSKDLELYENGKKARLIELQLRSQLPGIESAGVVSAIESRRFIIFIDLLNTRPVGIELVRPLLARLADENLRPDDEILLACLSTEGRSFILQDFTTSRERLHQVIKALKGNAARDNSLRNWEQQFHSILYPSARSSTSGGELNAEVDPVELASSIREATETVHRIAESESQSATLVLNSLSTLLEALDSRAELHGQRKSVILISEGFPFRPAQPFYDLLDERIRDYNEILDRRADLNQRLTRLFPVKPKFELYDLVREIQGRLNRNRATLYALDTRGAFTNTAASASRQHGGRDNQQAPLQYLGKSSVLSELAEGTGGLQFFQRPEFATAPERIENDNRLRYFLTYQPKKRKKKKKPQFLKIEVRCRRSGVKVRHRSGFVY